MGIGAERADAPSPAAVVTAPTPDFDYIGEAYALGEEMQGTPPDSRGPVLAPVLLIAALAWVAGSAWLASRGGDMSLDRAALLASAVSGPLVLLCLAWLMFGRTPRRETERFREAVGRMQQESMALESVLAIVAGRLEDNHARLTGEAAKLMSLGDEAADRLGRVTHYLARETAQLDKRAEALDAAAASARVDIGVLLHDLPRAEAQAEAMAEALKRTGIEAHSQAGALEGQLAAVAARGREADEIAGGAAQRLGAQLARIESGAAAASERVEQSAGAMKVAVDDAMSRAANAVDASRGALEAQSAAMLASIERNRTALAQAGEEAAHNLGHRLDGVAARIEGLAAHLAAQDAASHSLVDYLSTELGALETRMAELTQSGEAGADMLNSGFETVRTCARHLFDELQAGHGHAGALIDRAAAMADALAGVTQTLETQVPAALTNVEEQSARARTAAAAILPKVESIEAASTAAAARLAETGAAVERQDQAATALADRLEQGLAKVQADLQALTATMAEADATAAKVASSTAPHLVEAMLRVREAANVAAERARQAIGAVIPESAERLAQASGDALSAALAGPVAAQMAELGATAARATDTARHASERLTRQLITIGEAAAAVEQRIEEGRREREAQEAGKLPGRVSLLIESLHSAAIDVTKILSNEVTDAAWAAYLKGDRGVFTRRAVRLLDATEARDILRHYEEEPEFREQVNRYISDFENLLRRILADTDGSALSITILSSDMGKLYVALAQAIERLR